MRSPAWTREEVVLALELYLTCDRKVLGEERPEVIDLSRLLNRLSIHPEETRPANFRSPGAVELKLANIRALDPTTESVGMTSGSKVEREVWDEFADDLRGLRAAADQIRASR